MPVNWQDKVTPVDAQNLGIMQDDITEVQTNVDNLEEDMNTKFADVEEEISDKVSTLETSLEAEIEGKYAEVTENVKTNTTNISALQSSVESINTQIDDLTETATAAYNLFRTRTTLSNGENLDNYRSASIYWIPSASNVTSSEMPFGTSTAAFSLIVIYNVQLAIRYNTGEIKARTYTNSQWYPWTSD